MRHCLAAILVVGLAMSARDAAAQTPEEQAAYAAVRSTPLGALSPIMLVPGTKGEKTFNSFAGRYAHYAPQSGGDGNNNFGASFFHKAGMNAAVSGTVAYGTCNGCDGAILVGADVHSTLWNSAQSARSTSMTSVNLQGSVGYGAQSGDNAISLAVGLPLAVSMTQPSRASFGLFLTPGYAWGRVDIGGNTENGAVPFIGAGFSWISATGFGLHASYQRVIIEGAGNTFGGGFSWQLGR